MHNLPDSKSELYELSRIDAKPTKNSGRGKFEKGDGVIYVNNEPMFTCDVKEYAESFAVSIKSWAKISTDARANKSKPLFKLTLGKEEPKTRVVVIDENMFNMLMETYWKYEDLQ